VTQGPARLWAQARSQCRCVETPAIAPVVLPPRPVQTQEKRRVDWLRLILIIQKHWKISAAFAAVLMATVVVVTYSIKPVYEPVARESKLIRPESNSRSRVEVRTTTRSTLRPRLKTLKSDKLAIGVIHRLQLDQDPSDLLQLHRDGFIEKLKQAGIGTSVHFIPAQAPVLYTRTYGVKPEQFPHAEDAYARCISLPIYPGLTEQETKRVVHTVTDVVRKHRKSMEFVS
jgi:hypothetical protein